MKTAGEALYAANKAIKARINGLENQILALNSTKSNLYEQIRLAKISLTKGEKEIELLRAWKQPPTPSVEKTVKLTKLLDLEAFNRIRINFLT